MVDGLILKEAVSLISAIAEKKINKIKFNLNVNNSEIEKSVNNHIRIVKNWSSEVTFKDLKSSKETTKIFIPLDLYVYPKRIRIEESEIVKVIPLIDVISRENKHLAILGQPGAGKTTSMKFLCQSIFFNESFFPNRFKYPILVKLREFNNNRSSDSSGIIIEYLFGLLGLKIEEEKSTIKNSLEHINRTKENLVVEIMEKLNVLVIIDGFDEVAIKSHRSIILDEIEFLSNKLEISKLIITSRTADYNFSSESISVYEICPLNDFQIEEFAKKWLGNQNGQKFIDAVRKSPYNDTAIRPLTIAHLCAIYERIGKIPEKPKTVYKKIVNLLIEEWDEQRRIIRTSKYAMFEVDRKFEFLSNLAYHLTIKNGKAIFSKKDLLNVYKEIYVDFDLELEDSKSVINDVESHTGLFIQTGFELYEFAHKSIQEYLSAEYIVKLPSVPEQKRTLERLPNELAIAVTISSNPSMYFNVLVTQGIVLTNVSFDFVQKFINRLILEKPDFYKNEDVGIASLLLYSKYVKEELLNKNQLSLFNFDVIIIGFEDLIDSVFKRNSKKAILEIYEIVDTLSTVNQTKIHIMKMKAKPEKNIALKYMYRLPRDLYVRESFLE
jgi:hypothetical protein